MSSMGMEILMESYFFSSSIVLANDEYDSRKDSNNDIEVEYKLCVQKTWK